MPLVGVGVSPLNQARLRTQKAAPQLAALKIEMTTDGKANRQKAIKDHWYEVILSLLGLGYALFGLATLNLPVPILQDGEQQIVQLTGKELVVGVIGICVYVVSLSWPFLMDYRQQQYSKFKTFFAVFLGLAIFAAGVQMEVSS